METLIDRISAGTIEGYELWLEIEPDMFAYVDYDDSLTPKQIEAYGENRWQYVTATVLAVKHGVTLGQATYGELHFGFVPVTDGLDNLIETQHITAKDIDNYVGTELAYEAISRAEEVIKKIREEN